MWNTAAVPNSRDPICYVFHHWSGQAVDRSEVVVTSAGCTPLPRAEYDELGLPAWFLFRSVPQRLCPQAGKCTRCIYALGDIVGDDRGLGMDVAAHPAQNAFSMAF